MNFVCQSPPWLIKYFKDPYTSPYRTHTHDSILCTEKPSKMKQCGSLHYPVICRWGQGQGRTHQILVVVMSRVDSCSNYIYPKFLLQNFPCFAGRAKLCTLLWLPLLSTPHHHHHHASHRFWPLLGSPDSTLGITGLRWPHYNLKPDFKLVYHLIAGSKQITQDQLLMCGPFPLFLTRSQILYSSGSQMVCLGNSSDFTLVLQLCKTYNTISNVPTACKRYTLHCPSVKC